MKGCQLNWRALNLHHLFMNFELIFISKEKCLLWGSAMQKKCVVVSIDFRVSTSLCGDAVSSRYLTDFFAISSNKRWGAYFCIFVKRITLHYNINSAITQTFENGLAVTLQPLNAKKYPAVWFALKKGPVRSKHSASLTSYQVPARESPIYR